MNDDLANVLSNGRYAQGARHPDEGTIDPQEAASKERGAPDAIEEGIKRGIEATLRSEGVLPREVGEHASAARPRPAPAAGTSFTESRLVGPCYDDGKPIQEGDIVEDVNQCLAEVKSITRDGGVIINVPAVGLREVTSMKGCTLRGRK